jgi:hypothetical protein
MKILDKLWRRQIELIWKAKFGLGKGLYLISRYLAFFDVSLAIVCEFGA